jgi:hypothetical protein
LAVPPQVFRGADAVAPETFPVVPVHVNEGVRDIAPAQSLFAGAGGGLTVFRAEVPSVIKANTKSKSIFLILIG